MGGLRRYTVLNKEIREGLPMGQYLRIDKQEMGVGENYVDLADR